MKTNKKTLGRAINKIAEYISPEIIEKYKREIASEIESLGLRPIYSYRGSGEPAFEVEKVQKIENTHVIRRIMPQYDEKMRGVGISRSRWYYKQLDVNWFVCDFLLSKGKQVATESEFIDMINFATKKIDEIMAKKREDEKRKEEAKLWNRTKKILNTKLW